MCACAGVWLQMSHSQPELQGHSHKDTSERGLHQGADIPQGRGIGETCKVDAFSASLNVRGWPRCQHQTGRRRGTAAVHAHTLYV